MCGENPTFCNLGMGELQLSEGGWLENGHSYVVTSRATSGASKFRGLRVEMSRLSLSKRRIPLSLGSAMGGRRSGEVYNDSTPYPAGISNTANNCMLCQQCSQCSAVADPAGSLGCSSTPLSFQIQKLIIYCYC